MEKYKNEEFKIKLECSGIVNIENRTIEITQSVGSQATTWLLDCQEKIVREGLIKMGWTPPGEQK